MQLLLPVRPLGHSGFECRDQGRVQTCRPLACSTAPVGVLQTQNFSEWTEAGGCIYHRVALPSLVFQLIVPFLKGKNTHPRSGTSFLVCIMWRIYCNFPFDAWEGKKPCSQGQQLQGERAKISQHLSMTAASPRRGPQLLRCCAPKPHGKNLQEPRAASALLGKSRGP